MRNLSKFILSTVVLFSGMNAAQAQLVRVPKNLTGLANTNQSYDFGDVLTGQTVYTTFTYKNTSTQMLEFYSVEPKEGGTASIASTTCGTYLAAQDSCSFTVSLYVPATGIAGGTIGIGHNLSNAEDTLTVSANGVSASSKVFISPSSYTFNSSGEQKDFVVTNNTSNAIPLNNILSSKAQFLVQSNTCAGSISANSSCVIKTKFSANKTGTYSGILSLVSGGLTITKSSLTGVFAYGVPSFSGEMVFSNLTANQESVEKTATLTNIGIGVLYINNIDTDNPDVFKLKSNSCPTQLNPGDACNVTFSALVPKGGTYVGAMQTSVSNAAGSKFYWNLYADSAIPSKLLQAIPAVLNFEEINAGTTKQKTVAIQSVGNSPVKISGYTISGVNPDKFRIVNASDCTGDLSSGNECLLTVEAVSSSQGAFSASVEVTADVTEPFTAVPLQVNVLKPTLTPSPLAISVAGVKGGTLASNVTISNTGTTSANISSFALNSARPGVTLAGSCIGLTSLDKGASCTLTLNQTNLVIGTYSEKIKVFYGPGDQVLEIPVSTSVAGLDVELSPFTCSSAIESAAGSCTATIYNNTTAAVSLSSVSRTGTVFGTASASGTSIAANGSRVITLPFNIATAGTYSTNVSVSTSKGVFTGVATAVVSAGPPAVGTLSDFTCPSNITNQAGSCTATITNTSATKALVLGSMTSSNALFGAVTSNCGTSLAASKSCVVTLAYPGFTSGGTYSTTVSVISSQTLVKSATVAVTQPILSAISDVTAVAARGSTRKAYTVTFKNTGPVSLTVTDNALFMASYSSGVSPSLASGIAQSCTPGRVLAVGATCLLNITFDTTVSGSFMGSVAVKFTGGIALAKLDLKVLDSLYTVELIGQKQDTVGIGSLSGNWYKFTNFSASPVTLAGRWINYPAGNFNKITSYVDGNNSNHCAGGKVIAAGGSCMFLEYVSSFGYTADPSVAIDAKGTYIQLLNTSRASWDPSYTVKRAAISGSSPDAYVLNGTANVTLSLTNTADHALSGISVAVSSTKNSISTVSSSVCSTLAPQQSCNIVLKIKPTLIPSFNADTLLVTAKGNYARFINGVAQGVGDSVEIAKLSKAIAVSSNAAVWTVGKYPAAKIGASSQVDHVLTNKNAATIAISNISLTGASDQVIVGDTCTGATLIKDQSCKVTTQQLVPASRQVSSATLIAVNADGLTEQATVASNPAPLADLSVSVTAPFAAVIGGSDVSVKYTLPGSTVTGLAELTLTSNAAVTCVPTTACTGVASPVKIKYPNTGVVVTQINKSTATESSVTYSASIASNEIQDQNATNDTASAVTEMRGAGEWLGIVDKLAGFGASIDTFIFNANNRSSAPALTTGYKNPLWGGCWIYVADYVTKQGLNNESKCGYRYSHHVPFDNTGKLFTYTNGVVGISDMYSMTDYSTLSDAMFNPYAAYVSDNEIYVFNAYTDGTGSISTIRYSGTTLLSVVHSPKVALGNKFTERGGFARGPDGLIYVAMQYDVFKANPATGEISVVPSLSFPSGLPSLMDRFSYSYADSQQGINGYVPGSGIAFDGKGRAIRISSSCRMVEYPYLGNGTWAAPRQMYLPSGGNALNGCASTGTAAGGLYAHSILRAYGETPGKAVVLIYKSDSGVGAYSTTLRIQ